MRDVVKMKSPDGRAETVVDLANGGRLSSLQLDGRELLVTDADKAIDWGCYPMVPFAGRVREGVIEVDGLKAQLPATDDVHAIHGYGHVRPWTMIDGHSFRFDFDEPWPWSGSATQTVNLHDNGLSLSLVATAHERQPLTIGWHPWFRRDIGGLHNAELAFRPGSMFERDGQGIPSGKLIAPPPGPWDDCFTSVEANPILSWGDVEVELESTAEYWTVYDMPPHALCIEPQTGPPNSVNDAEYVFEAGEALEVRFQIGWTRRELGESET